MNPNIPKIEKLIRLATDAAASPEEARSAAHAACKLIVSNGLTLVDRPSSTASEPPPEPTESSAFDQRMRDWVNAGKAFDGPEWDWIKQTSAREAASKAAKAAKAGKPAKTGKAAKAGKAGKAGKASRPGVIDPSRHVVETRRPVGCAVCGM